MNPISFDTYIRRDAYLNGWDNSEPNAEGDVIFSSFCWRQQYDESNTSSINK